MSRYLVTGATGFLGRHLVDALVAAKHEVVGLGRQAGAGDGRRQVTLVAADVCDRAALAAAMTGCGGVFHCAGRVSHAPADAPLLWRVHVEGTRTVVAAARASGVGRIVLASSSGTIAVSRTSEVATEEHERPRGLVAGWPYYRTKLYAEEEALEASGDGLEVVSVNPSLLLGPGDERGSSTMVVAQAISGDVPLVPTGGLSFVDARDAALAMVTAMERGRAGARYLVGACNLTWRDFFGRLERLSGRRGPRLPLAVSPRVARLGAEVLTRALWRSSLPPPVTPVELEMAQHYWYVDSGLAERELLFAARDPQETLRDTVDDVMRQGRARAGAVARR